MRGPVPKVVLGLLGLVLTSCGGTGPATTHDAPAASASGPAGGWSLVALGDSVPAGSACYCTPYPELTAADLASASAVSVEAENEANGGFTTSDVLDQLTGGGSVVGRVGEAEVVEVEVGANDAGFSDTCGTAASCYDPKVAEVEANLRSIVHRIHELTASHQVRVVLLDYWSVWLGGQYAQEQGQAYVDAAAGVTDAVNRAIRDVADQTGSVYVDLRAAFKGPDYSYDETHYLASDGDHPNAAGHERIAAAVAEAVQPLVHPSSP